MSDTERQPSEPGGSGPSRNPPPAPRGRGLQRRAVGGLLGAAVIIGLGQLWARLGGT